MEEASNELERTCRTCMIDACNSLKSLFVEDEEFSVSLAEMINQCSSTKIDMNERLPLQICLNCEVDLRNAYAFRLRCDESYKLLHEIYVTNLISNSIVDTDSSETKTFSISKSLTPRMKYKQNVIEQELRDEETTDVDDLIEEDHFDAAEYTEPNTNDQVNVEHLPEDSQGQRFPPQKKVTVDEQSKALQAAFEEIEKSGLTYEKLTDPEDKRKRYQCKLCNKCFSRQTHVRRHLLTHSSIRPFQCDKCNKSFTRSDHLQKHSLMHNSDSTSHICTFCNKSFSRVDTFKIHIKRHTDPSVPQTKKIFTCGICSKTFASNKYLETHFNSHAAPRTYNCKFCPETFTDKKEMQEHNKFHINERPYLCTECGQRFLRNDYLVVHMRRHKGVKPYKCRYCEKAFPRATDLTVHERYHTEEKTHLCNVCGKGFHRAYNLLVHMRTHTGEKPYKCPHCIKSFAQGNDLKAHVRRHTGEKFKCDVCNKAFVQSYHLTRHRRRDHGIEEKSHIRRLEKFTTQSAQDIQILYRTHQKKLDHLVKQKHELESHQEELESKITQGDIGSLLQETLQQIEEVKMQLEQLEEQRQKILASQAVAEEYEADGIEAEIKLEPHESGHQLGIRE